jgi:acetyltransferase-like isoleucine patch superfamily enzyme
MTKRFRRVSRVIQSVATSAALRHPIRGLIAAGWACGRVWSHLRFRALFPSSERSVGHYSVQFKYPERIQMGAGVAIGSRVILGAMGGIRIGNFVRISSDVIIETGGLDLNTPVPYQHQAKPIVIEEGAWIGTRATILSGVTIGKYAVIGAGTVVSKSVPAHAIVVGAGMRILEAQVPEASAQLEECRS